MRLTQHYFVFGRLMGTFFCRIFFRNSGDFVAGMRGPERFF